MAKTIETLFAACLTDTNFGKARDPVPQWVPVPLCPSKDIGLLLRTIKDVSM